MMTIAEIKSLLPTATVTEVLSHPMFTLAVERANVEIDGHVFLVGLNANGTHNVAHHSAAWPTKDVAGSISRAVASM
jgi:hypothetical protein